MLTAEKFFAQNSVQLLVLKNVVFICVDFTYLKVVGNE